MNPQRERGIRAEREACAILTEALGVDVRRRANEGIRLDIGDLVGVPDTTVQVSAVPDNPTIIAKRATGKIVDVAAQAMRAGTAHAVVVLRVDGGHWRAVVDTAHLHALDPRMARGAPAVDDNLTPGVVIRWAPSFAGGRWVYIPRTDMWANTLDEWARDLRQPRLPPTTTTGQP